MTVWPRSPKCSPYLQWTCWPALATGSVDFASNSGRGQGAGLAHTQHYSHYLSLEGGGIPGEGTLPTVLRLDQCGLSKGYTVSPKWYSTGWA